MNLRGHHLLCLYGFRGLGYNEEFVDNLANVLNSLRINLKQELTLTDQADGICMSCPHCKDNHCLNKQLKPIELDRKILLKIGLIPGVRLRADKAFALIKRNISSDDLPQLCGKCQWSGLGHCAQGLMGKIVP